MLMDATSPDDNAESPPPPAPPALVSSPVKHSEFAAEDAAEEAAEYSEKYRIYGRDYLRRVNHKYFSAKNLAGTDRLFETATTVDGFLVKESSEAPIKKFLDSPNFQEEQAPKLGVQLSSAKKSVTRKG